MSEAINQAKLAMGLTSPNPPVGAVIVSKQNKIIGMGHTQAYGKNHAEIEANLLVDSKQYFIHHS